MNITTFHIEVEETDNGKWMTIVASESDYGHKRKMVLRFVAKSEDQKIITQIADLLFCKVVELPHERV